MDVDLNFQTLDQYNKMDLKQSLKTTPCYFVTGHFLLLPLKGI